jgi:hypothetical protein
MTRRVLLVVCVAALACGPRYARRPIESEPGVTVLLRGEKRGGEIVDRGYQHPATIAPVRITHILSQIDVRRGADEGGTREPAVPTDLLYPAGAAISRALAKAGPGEQVVVQAVRRERKLIFTTDSVTTLLCYVKDERLVVHVRHLDDELPKDERRDQLPEPWLDRRVDEFRVVPGEAMTLVGPQEVAVDWRDEAFRQPRRISVTPTGVHRRTILMESPEAGDTATPEEPERAGELSPETLRALADLEEARRSGQVSESEYQARRRELLGED